MLNLTLIVEILNKSRQTYHLDVTFFIDWSDLIKNDVKYIILVICACIWKMLIIQEACLRSQTLAIKGDIVLPHRSITVRFPTYKVLYPWSMSDSAAAIWLFWKLECYTIASILLYLGALVFYRVRHSHKANNPRSVVWDNGVNPRLFKLATLLPSIGGDAHCNAFVNQRTSRVTLKENKKTCRIGLNRKWQYLNLKVTNAMVTPAVNKWRLKVKGNSGYWKQLHTSMRYQATMQRM